jgi:hypothetical protein
MENTWSPTCESGLVASVTVVDGCTSKSTVRDVICCRPICRGISATMASGALVGHRSLGVIPFCRRPTHDSMACKAIQRRRDVAATLTRRRSPVMAGRAIGAGIEAAVVRLIGRQPGRGLVATVTRSRCRHVSGRLPRRSTAIVARRTRPRHDASMIELRARKCSG